jgi:hypothetical protein
MGKLSRPPQARRAAADRRRRVGQLRAKRRELAVRIQQLDTELGKLTPRSAPMPAPSPDQLDQWFEQISQGLPELPPLPTDFSRADLYDDHD